MAQCHNITCRLPRRCDPSMRVHKQPSLGPADRSKDDVSTNEDEEFLKTLEKVSSSHSVGRQSHTVQGLLRNLSMLPFS